MKNRKRCPKCLKQRPVSKFKKRPDGTLSGYCYQCQLRYYKEYNKKRYASPGAREKELRESKKKYDEVIRPARIQRKLKLIMMIGGKCVRCGYCKNIAALDFHHTDKTTKRRTLGNLLMYQTEWAWQEAVKEATHYCEILCSNCHREETYPGWELDDLLKQFPPDE